MITDKNEALIVVRQNGYALEYASEELRNDREVVLEAVKQDDWALRYASDELQNEIRQKIQQFINNLK